MSIATLTVLLLFGMRRDGAGKNATDLSREKFASVRGGRRRRVVGASPRGEAGSSRGFGMCAGDARLHICKCGAAGDRRPRPLYRLFRALLRSIRNGQNQAACL